MPARSKSFAVTALLAAVLATPVGVASAHSRVQHVLLVSVDGLHQADVRWSVRHHPGSELARLAGRGIEYAHARTPVPSDSFPGMVAQVTGGDPRVTGVYYDAELNHDLLPRARVARPAAPTAPSGRRSSTTSRSTATPTRSTRDKACRGSPTASSR